MSDQLISKPAGVHLILAEPWSKDWGQPHSDCCQMAHQMLLDLRYSGSPPDSCRPFYRKSWT